MINCIYSFSTGHTCPYSQRCIADSRGWYSNPVVSSMGYYCISDSKCSAQIIVSRNRDGNHVILIHHFCSACILY